MIPQAPVWLPYRCRLALDQWRLERALSGLERTAPRSASAAEDAPVEVHMLLCRRDVKVGVLSLKSLLRVAQTPLAVALSNDGSVDRQTRDWIDRHVPGCRWLEWNNELVAQPLADKPRLLEVYRRRRYAPIAKLLHPILLGRCDKVIVVDPDTAWFARPSRLLDWARRDGAHDWYLHDHQDEKAVVPAELEGALDALRQALAPAARTWGLDYRFFNSGLLAFKRARMDLNLVEGYLRWRETVPPHYLRYPLGMWFNDWCREQTAYHVMMALSSPPAKPLGEDYHLGGEPGHVFNHFLRHYLVQSATLRRLRALILEL